jgi:hypothetical protein
VGLLQEQYPESSLGLDHLAFRTFGVRQSIFPRFLFTIPHISPESRPALVAECTGGQGRRSAGEQALRCSRECVTPLHLPCFH